jgi:hypothetical protein
MITTEPKKNPFLLLCRFSYSVSYRSSGNEAVAQINVPSRDNHRIVSRSVSYRASVHSALFRTQPSSSFGRRTSVSFVLVNPRSKLSHERS